eukprot:1049438-Pyramimonas_sp.AAC.1
MWAISEILNPKRFHLLGAHLLLPPPSAELPRDSASFRRRRRPRFISADLPPPSAEEEMTPPSILENKSLFGAPH